MNLMFSASIVSTILSFNNLDELTSLQLPSSSYLHLRSLSDFTRHVPNKSKDSVQLHSTESTSFSSIWSYSQFYQHIQTTPCSHLRQRIRITTILPSKASITFWSKLQARMMEQKELNDHLALQIPISWSKAQTSKTNCEVLRTMIDLLSNPLGSVLFEVNQEEEKMADWLAGSEQMTSEAERMVMPQKADAEVSKTIICVFTKTWCLSLSSRSDCHLLPWLR